MMFSAAARSHDAQAEAFLSSLAGVETRDVVLAALEFWGLEGFSPAEVLAAVRRLNERNAAAAEELAYAVRLLGLRSATEKQADRQNEAAPALLHPVPSRPSPMLQRILSAEHAADVPRDNHQESAEEDEDGATASPDLAAVLESLPPLKALPDHTARLHAQNPAVARSTRRNSRGYAILFILDQYGRSRPLTLQDFVAAFRTMGLIEPAMSPTEARRVVGWEIAELRRRGWPISKIAGEGYRMSGAEGTMA